MEQSLSKHQKLLNDYGKEEIEIFSADIIREFKNFGRSVDVEFFEEKNGEFFYGKGFNVALKGNKLWVCEAIDSCENSFKVKIVEVFAIKGLNVADTIDLFDQGAFLKDIIRDYLLESEKSEEEKSEEEKLFTIEEFLKANFLSRYSIFLNMILKSDANINVNNITVFAIEDKDINKIMSNKILKALLSGKNIDFLNRLVKSHIINERLYEENLNNMKEVQTMHKIYSLGEAKKGFLAIGNAEIIGGMKELENGNLYQVNGFIMKFKTK